MKSAVLFLMFARSDLAARSFEAIRQARPSRLYLAADGPRADRPEDSAACSATRDAVEALIDWPCEVHRLYRNKNLGVRLAVAGGITWFFQHEKQGIIIEDDVLASPDFFLFCDELLERYETRKDVGAICGMSYLKKSSRVSYYASQFPDMWGWATWADRWARHDPEMREWPAFEASGGLKRMVGANKLFTDYWCRIMNKTSKGVISTWDYQWILTCWKLGLTSIHSAKPLVLNIGYGPGASNTPSTTVPKFCRPIEKLSWPLQHPTTLHLDDGIERRIWRVRFGLTPVNRSMQYLRLFAHTIMAKRSPTTMVDGR